MNYLCLLLICLLINWNCFSNSGQKSKIQKLTVSENGRYLTAGGKPFFWLGDTGWLMLSKLNRSETETYLEGRKEKGFNVIQVMLLHSLEAVNVSGDSGLIHKNIENPQNDDVRIGF